MKQGKILEELWYSDVTLRVTEWALEAEKLMDKLDECEDTLFADLTREQKDALDDYKTGLLELRTLFEKDAFKKGIRFATAYMAEAMMPSGK